jgi:hypothetical protein
MEDWNKKIFCNSVEEVSRLSSHLILNPIFIMIMRLQSLSLLAAVALTTETAGAFTLQTRNTKNSNPFTLASTAPSDDAAFSSFADSLEQDSSASTTAKASAATNKKFSGKSNTLTPGPVVAATSTWKNDLDEILNPTTAQARRQILVSQLLTANAEIRASVEAALRDRKVSNEVLRES